MIVEYIIQLGVVVLTCHRPFTICEKNTMCPIHTKCDLFNLSIVIAEPIWQVQTPSFVLPGLLVEDKEITNRWTKCHGRSVLVMFIKELNQSRVVCFQPNVTSISSK